MNQSPGQTVQASALIATTQDEVVIHRYKEPTRLAFKLAELVKKTLAFKFKAATGRRQKGLLFEEAQDDGSLHFPVNALPGHGTQKLIMRCHYDGRFSVLLISEMGNETPVPMDLTQTGSIDGLWHMIQSVIYGRQYSMPSGLIREIQAIDEASIESRLRLPDLRRA